MCFWTEPWAPLHDELAVPSRALSGRVSRPRYARCRSGRTAVQARLLVGYGRTLIDDAAGDAVGEVGGTAYHVRRGRRREQVKEAGKDYRREIVEVA